MAGAFLAVKHFANPVDFEKFGRNGIILAPVTIAILAIIMTSFPPIQSISMMHVLTFVANATVGSLVLCMALCWNPFKALLSNKILCYIGKRSYGLYLFHTFVWWLVRAFICPIFQVRSNSATEWALVAGIGIPLTLIMSELSWHFIEKRFWQYRHLFNPLENPKVSPGAKSLVSPVGSR